MGSKETVDKKSIVESELNSWLGAVEKDRKALQAKFSEIEDQLNQLSSHASELDSQIELERTITLNLPQ